MSDHRPTVALLVMTDGRDELLGHTILSFLDRVNSSLFTEFWMFDDTGLIDHRGLVRGLFPDFQHMPAGGGRRGFGGAIREAWAGLREHSTAEFIFHLEDDFTFNRRIPVDRMANLLRVQPWLAQVALRRQAWNDTERAAGGVVETNPDAYTQTVNSQLGAWLEHSLFWTTNPSLYRREIMLAHDWPDGDHSEGVFTHQLRDAGYRFAYWGRRDDEPWVHHIGEERAGTGY